MSLISLSPVKGSGNTGFTPRSVSGIVGWWNAKRRVVTSGSNVTRWPDLGPNGYDLAPGLTVSGGAGAVGTPTYDATGLLGQPTINFNGSGQGLSREGIGGARTAYTFWMVVSPTATGSDATIWYAPNASTWVPPTNSQYGEFLPGSTRAINIFQQDSGNKATSGARSVVTGKPQIFVFTYNGSTAKTYINGIEMGSQAVANGVIGDRLSLATLLPKYSGFDWNAKISEVALYNKALSQTEIDSLTAYARTEWFSSLYASPYSFLYSGTRFSGGTPAALKFSKTQKLAFSCWYKTVTVQKGSIFCFEKVTPNYPGWDALIYGGKWAWYAAQDYGGGDYLLTRTSVAVPNVGKQFVHLVVYCDGTGTRAGTKFFLDGELIANEPLSGDQWDNLTGDMNTVQNEFFMGDANLDSGNDFLAGYLKDAAIIVGETVDASFIRTYLAPYGYPGDLTSCPGLAHWWHKYDVATPDTTSTIIDRVGGIDLSVEVLGSGAITSVSPMV